MRRRLGKGAVIWSALPIEAIHIYEYQEIFKNLLFSMCDGYEPSFGGNIPEDVEAMLYDAGDVYTINLCMISERPVAPVYPPFTLKVKTERAPKSVKFLPAEEEIPFVYENGYTVFETRPLHVFDKYMIEK